MPASKRSPSVGRAPRRALDAGVNVTELSRLLGFTREMVRQWTLKGCPRRDDGSFVVAEVVAWLRQRERESAASETAPDEAQERARKLRAEADLKEIELAKARGDLVPVGEYRSELEVALGRMRAVVSGQLARFERRMVACGTAAEARQLARDIEEAICIGGVGLADALEDDDAEDAA